MLLTRREILKGGIAVAGSAALIPDWLRKAAQAAPLDTAGRMLVVIELSGGNDGLNTVIPIRDSRYSELRPRIGLDASKVLPITSDLALHPAMAGIQRLFKQGKLAVIEGAGYPNPNRSHFRSMEIWQTANPDVVEYYGWLGKYMDASRKTDDALAAAAILGDLPLALYSAKSDVPAIDNISSYGLQTLGDRAQSLELFRKINGQPAKKGSDLEHIQQVSIDALESSEELKRKVKASDAPYPANQLAPRLKEAARLLGAGVGAQIVYARLGGFDTHANQPNTQERLLKALSESVEAFWNDISTRGLADRTLVFTFSEFGRRVKENGGMGTDHGTAGPMFVLGGKVKGGQVFGDPPDLNNLDSNGDLKYQIDFRRVYSTILSRWFSVDPAQALKGRFEDIAFI